MAYQILNKRKPDVVTASQVYYEELNRLMDESSAVMHLEADLGMSIMGANLFALSKAHPSQVLDCGIQEANMVGIAAGLSVCGRIPFAHSFSPFLSRRACDQIFISCAYNKANVKLIGSDPGVMAAFNGGTHMPFEDLAILRSFPEMTVVEFSDATMARWLLSVAAKHRGNMYIRFTRKNTTAIYGEGSSFELGKANILRDGDDVTLIGCGILVGECLKAAEFLAKEGIQARVIDMFTIKPIDREMILDSVKRTGAIVTAENHNVIGGLGSAVSDVLCETEFAPIEKIGVQDSFGQVGPYEELMQIYHLTAEDIVCKAKKAISRKQA